MKIRKAKKEDIIPASELVSKTFARFNSKEGTEEGIKVYINFHNPKKNLEEIKKSYLKSPIFLVAVEKGKIVGMLRGNPSRIINLFVDGRYHKQGIAKNLVKRFEEISKEKRSSQVKIRASLYAVPFYEKVGYKKTTGIRNFLGIKIQPMVKELK